MVTGDPAFGESSVILTVTHTAKTFDVVVVVLARLIERAAKKYGLLSRGKNVGSGSSYGDVPLSVIVCHIDCEGFAGRPEGCAGVAGMAGMVRTTPLPGMAAVADTAPRAPVAPNGLGV